MMFTGQNVPECFMILQPRTVTMKKKLPSENRHNFFDTYPLELCFGEQLAVACPNFLSPKTYQTDTGCSRTVQ